jgi:acetylornithine deacetylase/succinyl-diaminopimelate desuccinylase-like protein
MRRVRVASRRRLGLLAALSLLLTLAAGAACAKRKDPNPERSDLIQTPEEWLAREPIRLLRDYVRIDTSEEAGEEEGAKFLRSILDCEGIETEIVCPAPKRCSLLARLPGRSREGALLLLNHIDIAPAGARFWKEAQPFEGLIRGGYLYGRGAYDDKSLAIAQALALRSLWARGVVPRSDVLFLAEADEEIGQRWGARWLLDHRPDWFRGVTAVLNEGGVNEMILRDVRFWALETLQAGYATAELESTDAAALETLQRRWPKLSGRAERAHPHVVVGFDLLANHLSHPLTDPLRHLDRVLASPNELAILPDRYGSFLEPRIYWSPVYSDPSDPARRQRRYVIISVPPGVRPGPFLAAVEEDARRSGVVIRHSFAGEASAASPYDGPDGKPMPIVELLKTVTEAYYPGVPFGPVPTAGGYTTSGLFRARGIPAYGYSPIPMNIFDSARRHGPDERIYLRDYLNGVAIYEEVLEGFALGS